MGHPSDLPVGELLLTVFNSILEVFLLCLAGYILARKGVLDKKTQKQLNKINVNLFTPALLFSKVAFFLSPSKLRELYIIPIFFLAATFVSLLISYLLSTAFKLKRTQRNFAIAAAMFMNSNSLPIALMQSLVGSVKGLKWKKNGEDGDTKDAMLGRALTYLVLASTMGMILRWSFGVRLLAAADDPTPPPSPTITYNHQPLSSDADHERRAAEGLVPSTSSATLVQDTPPNAHLRPPQFRRNTTYYRSFPNTPNQEFLSLPSEGSSRRESVVSLLYEPNEDEEALPGPATPAQPQHPTHSMVKRICKRLRRSFRSFMQFMTPPLWASLLSLVVAMVPPLQKFLAEDLGPVRGMLDKAGGCSIPVTLVVLGGYFCEEPKETGESAKVDTKSKPIDARKSLDADTLVGSVRGLFTRRKPHSRGKIYLPTDPEEDLDDERLLSFSRISTATQWSRLELEREQEKKKRKGETKTVVIAIVSRMILCPIVLVPAVVYGAKGGFGGVFEDPIFTLSLLLLLCSPPALTLAQITQAASGDAFERLISKTIFWSYVVVTPPVMVGVVVGGVLVGRV